MYAGQYCQWMPAKSTLTVLNMKVDGITAKRLATHKRTLQVLRALKHRQLPQLLGSADSLSVSKPYFVSGVASMHREYCRTLGVHDHP